jgi:hypothetical protein
MPERELEMIRERRRNGSRSGPDDGRGIGDAGMKGKTKP